MKKICQRVDATGSATECKTGSGRPQSALSVTNIERVEELICSQDRQSGQHLSTHEIAAELDISDRSVRRIAKKDLHLNAFCQVPAQVLNVGTKQKRLCSVPQLCLVDSEFVTRNVFSSLTRQFFYLNPPVSNQNNRVWAGGKKADIKKFAREVCAACDSLGWHVFWWQGTTSLC